MESFQVVGSFACTNKGKHINLSGLHQSSNRFSSAAVNDVDHSRWERVAKGFEQWADKQYAVFGRLEHHSVSHDERRKHGGESFIEWIIKRTHAHLHSKRHPSDLPHYALLLNELG